MRMPYLRHLLALGAGLGCLACMLLLGLALPPAAAQQSTPAVPTLTPAPTDAQLIGVEQQLNWLTTLGERFGWSTPLIIVLLGIIIVVGLLLKGAGAAIEEAGKQGGQHWLGRLGQLLRRQPNRLDYLAWLRQNYGEIKPIGIARNQRVPLDIARVHIPLRIEEQQLATGLADAEAIDRTLLARVRGRGNNIDIRVLTLLSDAELIPRPRPDWRQRLTSFGRRLIGREQPTAPPKPVESAPFPTTRRLLLAGVAGSGKTTTLRYATICLAEAYARQRRRRLQLADLGLYLARPVRPVYVRLVEFSRASAYFPPNQHDAPSLEQFFTWLDAKIAQAQLTDVRELSSDIKAGRCMLFFDGLDEAGNETRRTALAALIAQLAERYPQNRYLIASRPAALVGMPLLKDFQRVTLGPLNEEEARSVVQKWFAVADSHRAAEETNRLWRAIRRNDRLRQMATRPLLLTAMAALHFDETTLPDERAKLYEALIELLLGKWRLRQIDLNDPADEENARRLRDERPVIEDLALLMQMRDDQATEVTLAQAQEWLINHYTPGLHPDAARHRISSLLETLDLDSGLMQQRGDAAYAFAHYSFQEYLAACALDDLDRERRGRSVEFLQERSTQPRWRETLLLACGRWSSGRTIDLAEQLIAGLLAQHKLPALLLAADALADIRPEKLPALRTQAIEPLLHTQHTTALLRAGAALADGWPVPDHLREQGVQCLRALAFDPQRCPDPGERNQAAELLDRLDADKRPALDPRQPDYWAEPIAPGPFLMGDDKGKYNGPKPAFIATIHRAYALARFPVTNRQYQCFLAALKQAGKTDEAKQHRPRVWSGDGYPAGTGNHPVTGVSWHDAMAFAAWLDGELRQAGILRPDEQICLPSEIEWERAAAYPRQLPPDQPAAGRREYPWGAWPSSALQQLAQRIQRRARQPQANRPRRIGVGRARSAASRASQANLTNTTTRRIKSYANTQESRIGGPSVVGIFPHGAADCGAEDLVGNVWEWCRNTYQDYPLRDEAQQESLYTKGKRGHSTYVLRGGGWLHDRSNSRCAVRGGFNPDRWSDFHGLRVARLFSLR